jgi:hypothetical protein
MPDAADARAGAGDTAWERALYRSVLTSYRRSRAAVKPAFSTPAKKRSLTTVGQKRPPRERNRAHVP